jgi:hypothetical protein
MKAFKDMSIFQGIVDYIDNEGQEWRRKNEECVFTFFKKVEDSFLCQGQMIRSGRSSIKCVHDKFLCCN